MLAERTIHDDIFRLGHDRIRHLEETVKTAQKEILAWREILEQQGIRGYCGSCGVIHGETNGRSSYAKARARKS